MRKTIVVAGLIASTLACGQAQAGDKLGAVLGGAALGTAGGLILGSALANANRPQSAPAYYVAPPPPRPAPVEYVEAAPRRVMVERSPFDGRAADLHMRCDDGDRHACIRFGILIGQHHEHIAEWRRSHPDFFSYED